MITVRDRGGWRHAHIRDGDIALNGSAGSFCRILERVSG
jgi:hypothetical protein